MNLVYNTVFTPIRATSIRGKLVHNTHVQQIETTQISGNEFWSFAKKKIETLSATITKVRELLEMNNSNLIKWAAPLS